MLRCTIAHDLFCELSPGIPKKTLSVSQVLMSCFHMRQAQNSSSICAIATHPSLYAFETLYIINHPLKLFPTMLPIPLTPFSSVQIQVFIIC